jgi:mono/diheme cytochrome c family protein
LNRVFFALATSAAVYVAGVAVSTRGLQHPAPLQAAPPAQPGSQPPGSQPPGPQPPGGGPGGGLGGDAAKPAQDKAAVDRGKAAFGIHCGFCHGSDARGGSTGPNLWRSVVVLTDRDGSAVAQVVREGRPDKGMPPMNLADPQIEDVVAYLHSLPVGGRDPARMRPPSIVVGDATQGERYFQRTCAGCHSTTGDLRGLAAKYPDPRQLQHAWLMPGSQRGAPGAASVNRRPSATVTLATGETFKGTLARIDDFVVSLTDEGGTPRTFKRTAAGPKIDIQDKLAPHRDLVPTYQDADIHNLTAYLVTLK